MMIPQKTLESTLNVVTQVQTNRDTEQRSATQNKGSNTRQVKKHKRKTIRAHYSSSDSDSAL